MSGGSPDYHSSPIKEQVDSIFKKTTKPPPSALSPAERSSMEGFLEEKRKNGAPAGGAAEDEERDEEEAAVLQDVLGTSPLLDGVFKADNFSPRPSPEKKKNVKAVSDPSGDVPRRGPPVATPSLPGGANQGSGDGGSAAERISAAAATVGPSFDAGYALNPEERLASKVASARSALARPPPATVADENTPLSGGPRDGSLAAQRLALREAQRSGAQVNMQVPATTISPSGRNPHAHLEGYQHHAVDDEVTFGMAHRLPTPHEVIL